MLCAELLKQGKIIIFPAETLYGFSCSLFSRVGIDSIFDIKKRSSSKQFITLVGSFEMASDIADISPQKMDFLKSSGYWPNHLTIVFSSKLKDYKTIAIRFSSSPYIKELFRYIDFPIISTSVNYSDTAPLRDIDIIKQEFSDKVSYFNTIKPQSEGSASTIISFIDDISLIREGDIPYRDIVRSYDEFRNKHR